MPLYTYTCCDKHQDEFRSVVNRNRGPKCPTCGKKMQKVISRYSAIGDMEPYYDDNLSTYIKSRQHRSQVMRDQGVYEKIGKGWR